MSRAPTLRQLNAQVTKVQEDTDQKFKHLDSKMNQIIEALTSGTSAKNNPVQLRNEVEPREDTEFITTINHHNEIVKPKFDDIRTPTAKEKLDRIKFDHEILTVYIHEQDTDDTVKNMFPVSVNGKGWLLEQGKEYKLPRNAVEVLLRSRRTSYSSHEYVDNKDGIKKVAYPTRINTRFPISIMHDPNPKGREWINAIKQSHV